MTSASELFYNRRSRFDRNTTLDLGLDSPVVVDRISYHNRRQSHHNHPNRRDRATDINIDNNCDPLRRSSNPARPIHRLSFPHAQEREPVRVEQGTSQSASSNVINPENFRSIRNRESFSGNDRLPGAVLLARERLLERLRGVSSSRNRQRSRVSSGLNEDDFTFGVNNRIADPEEWDINSRTDWLLASEETRKRPPGLTKEALNSLHTVIFINQEEESVKMRASKECSICLDSFLVGEKLLCLPCGHRFHSCCLEPWIRACGDCPNCRTGIVVSNYRPVK